MLPRRAASIVSTSAHRPFRCRACHRLTPFRSLATQTKFPTIPASPDDAALVSLFDHPGPTFKRSPLSTTGLFGHPSLAYPDALISLADATLVRAQLLTDRILRARESRDELLKVVKNLDRLSDMLCGVTDLSELIRNAHPDPTWIRAADYAYDTLCEFMNVLNTHVGLYEVRLYRRYLFCIAYTLVHRC